MTSVTSSASDIFIEGGKHEYRIKDASLTNAARKAIFGVQQLADSGTIEKSLQELVKIRASQINGCAYCLAMHWKGAIDNGERLDRLSTVSAWREADWFTPRERAALAWTEAVTDMPANKITEALFQECREVFSEQEMVDLMVNIVAINSWNRVAVGFSARPDAWEIDK